MLWALDRIHIIETNNKAINLVGKKVRIKPGVRAPGVRDQNEVQPRAGHT